MKLYLIHTIKNNKCWLKCVSAELVESSISSYDLNDVVAVIENGSKDLIGQYLYVSDIRYGGLDYNSKGIAEVEITTKWSE